MQSFLRIALLSCICFFGNRTYAQDEFITVWNTANPGDSGADQIIISTWNAFLFDINWEEVSNPANSGYQLADFGYTTVTFPHPGIYRVKITPGIGVFDEIKTDDGGDGQKLIDIEQWGDVAWSSMFSAFSSCTNLTVLSATDIPDLSSTNQLSYMFNLCTQLTHIPNLEDWNLSTITQMAAMFQAAYAFNQDITGWNISTVTDITSMFFEAWSFNQDIGDWDVSNVHSMWYTFSGARVFNQDIGDWDVSNVTVMEGMFFGAFDFNQDIGDWDVSKVTLMGDMFWDAQEFDQDISGWDVSNVTDMRNMFNTALAFNQDISGWDVSNVTSMEAMFLGAESFDQDLSNWDVSKVTNIYAMFLGAVEFNADIRNWDVGKVTNMASMFAGHPLFNQDIGGWNVSQVSDMQSMFEGAEAFNHALGGWQLRPGVNISKMLSQSAMDCTNYSRTLFGWSANPDTPDDLFLGAIGLEYGADATAARNALLAKGWTITDSGEDEVCPFSKEEFITVWQSDSTGISANNQVTIPAIGSGFNIQWQNVDIPAFQGSLTGNGATTITFPQSGTYRIRINPDTGTFHGIVFDNSGDRLKLMSVEQWGTSEWTDFAGAFHGCENLSISAVDIPVFDGVNSMRNMFRNCQNLGAIPNMNAWDVSLVTDMGCVFAEASTFNQVISAWDVSNVEHMDSMFFHAEAFNRDISAWDVGAVTEMQHMFDHATTFDQDIDGWNTSSVENMRYMFFHATSFNRRLENWDLGSLVPALSPMTGMLEFTAMDCNAYSFTLIGWYLNPLTPSDITLDASNLNYSPEATTARNGLIADGWTITDAGTDVNCELYSDKFITVWRTTNPGVSATNQVRIPASGTNFSIYWEDVSNTSVNGTLTSSGTTTITFPEPGTYRVKIYPGSGTFNRINFGNLVEESQKLLEIERWGTIPWTSFQTAFFNCTNLTVTATDTVILSGVTNTSSMFSGCRSLTTAPSMHAWNTATLTNTSLMFYDAINFNNPIGSWNVGNVTNMSNMFYQATAFNQNIGAWNVSKVTNMSQMFFGATAFNQDIGNWNTGLVTNMSMMFQGAFSFNQNLNNWNVSKVTTMSQMFLEAISFNGNISSWNTSMVTNMGSMFAYASAFNGAIGSWNTSNVTNMFGTFNGATAFNQSLSGWNTAKVTTMFVMFQDARLFNQNIGNWNTSKVTEMSSMFAGAHAFNQDISGWDVSKVTAMSGMFRDAYSFNQDISTWDVRKVTNMANTFIRAQAFNHSLGDWQLRGNVNLLHLFSNSGMDCDNYGLTLMGWADNDSTALNRTLTLNNIEYLPAAADARDTLIIAKGWSITDGGEVDACPYQSPRVYVDQSATGNNNGVSWYHAFHDLQDALEVINDYPGLKEIWIAEGIYVPAVNDRDSAFALFDSVSLIGGFLGTETLLTERIGDAGLVILSGNTGAQNLETDNAYHVVRGGSSCINCSIDQLTIRDGNANGTGMQSAGAGILNTGVLSVVDCIIEENTGSGAAAIFNTDLPAELHLQDCLIRMNDSGTQPDIINANQAVLTVTGVGEIE